MPLVNPEPGPGDEKTGEEWGGVVGRAGRNQRQGWCRHQPQARGCARSSGLRRQPRGWDFSDCNQAALPKEAGVLLVVIVICWFRWGAVESPGYRSMCGGRCVLDPQPGRLSLPQGLPEVVHTDPGCGKETRGVARSPELRIQNVLASNSVLPPPGCVSAGPFMPWALVPM